MKQVLSLSVRYRLVAFVAGFILMVYELSASRILAPTVGSSTYVWTSVIGVIIAALSIGYFLGGRLADKRARQNDICWLLLAVAVCIISTLALYPSVLNSLATSALDQRFQGLLGALLLFAPASVVLGAISPYLVKMHTTTLEHAGRSVASLSALNSIGGITGTFLAGFVLFSFIGSRETLILLVAVTLFVSWLPLQTKHLKKHSMIVGGIVFFTLLLVHAPNQEGVVADIDTPSSHYQVQDIWFGLRPTRVITTGSGGYQSGVDLENPNDLVFRYTQKMAEKIAALPEAPRTIAVLGGGTFTLPSYLAKTYPDAQIDVVEIDPQLESIAIEYFKFKPLKNLKVIANDARTYVNTTTHQYDAVVIDVFNDDGIPFTFTTTEFAQAIKRVTTERGYVLMNVIAGDTSACKPLLASIHQSFLNSFGDGFVEPIAHSTLAARQNLILSYSRQVQPITSSEVRFSPDSEVRLTDNFAPIERLQQNCRAT